MLAGSTVVMVTGLVTGLFPQEPAAAVQASSVRDAVAVLAEVDRLAARDLWPGFAPGRIPVAIFDGSHTVLLRHPAPPADFQPAAGLEAVWIRTGRHPAVIANSSADIGGVRTATLLGPTPERGGRERAGVLIHEAFHVFQAGRHPGWAANEAELFTYPVDDSAQAALRHLETEALSRALTRPGEEAACWARLALELRQRRFAALPPGPVAYERATELHEGLAAYVQHRALAEQDGSIIPSEGFAVDAVRQRAYATGTALARLLDRFDPAWQEALDRVDSTSLDQRLAGALGTEAPRSPCRFSSAEEARMGASAGRGVRDLISRRTERRRAFLAQEGWTIVMVADDNPLFPQGFDPLNVDRVGPGEVLHTRFLRLGNEAASVEVLGRAALTEGAGAHPLFSGARTLTVSGLPAPPRIVEDGETVTVSADGVSARIRGAVVERGERAVTIHLGVRTPVGRLPARRAARLDVEPDR